MVSTHPLISKSSSPLIYPLVTVLSTPISIGITGIFIFHSFFSSPAKPWYLSLFSLSFNFTPWSARMQFGRLSFFLLTITRFGHLTKIKGSIWIPKFQRILCISFSRMDSRLCMHHLFVQANLNFLHNSHWIAFPTQLCLILYSLILLFYSF